MSDQQQISAEPPPTTAASIRGGTEASVTSAAGQSAAPNGAAGRNHLVGNTHRQTHGVWSFLALGKLPKGASYIRRLMGELRRELERCVNQAHGEVSLAHAALVTTVCRHEGRALLLSRYLALEGDGLKLLDRMALLESIGRATDARDKAIRCLQLDAGGKLDDLYAELRAGAIDQASEPANAPEAKFGGQASPGDEFQPGFGGRVDPQGQVAARGVTMGEVPVAWGDEFSG